jgi:hypothetical protein
MLYTGKVLGRNKILNKVIKAAVEAEVILLSNTTTTYL